MILHDVLLLCVSQASMGPLSYARSKVNKRNELNITVEDIDPHIMGITESWAATDISDAELGMTGYVMFRKDRLGRRGVALYYIL